MSADVVAFVFARGGSKGVPGKNLRRIAGRSLLEHAVAAARGARRVGRVIVSTDDAAIAAAARAAGAEVPFLRPAELARDDSPEWLAWRHALDNLAGVGAFVSVPTTSPLRDPADIDACVARLERGDVDAVITVTPAHRNPWFNMVTVDAGGLARLVLEPKAAVHGRQAAPPVFDITTVCYAARPEFVRLAAGLFEGRVGTVEVPAERALDIDTELDLVVAEALFAARKGAP